MKSNAVLNLQIFNLRFVLRMMSLCGFFVCGFSAQYMHGQIERDIHKKYVVKPQYRIEEIYKAETDLRKRWKQGPYKANYFRQLPNTSTTVTKSARGSYDVDKRIGQWLIKEDSLTYYMDSVIDYRPFGQFKGDEKRWRYSYDDGRPVKAWSFVHHSIAKDTIQDILKSGNIYWDRDSLYFESHDLQHRYTVSGTFTDDGFMHGTWTMQYWAQGVRIEESRRYTSGFLTGYALKDLSTQTIYEDVQFKGIHQHIEKWLNKDSIRNEPIIVDTLPLRHMNTFMFEKQYKEDMKPGDQAIFYFASQMLSPIDFDSCFVEVIDQNDFLKTRVLRKPISQQELTALQQIQNKSIPDLIDRIHRFKDGEIFTQHRGDNLTIKSELKNLELLVERFQAVKEGVSYLFTDEFQYQNFSLFDVYVIDGIDEDITIHTIEGDSIVSQQASIAVDPDQNATKADAISSYIGQLESLMTQSFRSLDRERVEIQKREELSTFASRLKERQSLLDRSFSEKIKTESAAPALSSQKDTELLTAYAYNEFVQYQLNEKISTFDNIPGYSQALQYYNEVNLYVDSLQQISELLQQVYSKSKPTVDWFDYGPLKEDKHYRYIYQRGMELWNHYASDAQKSSTLSEFQGYLNQISHLKNTMSTLKDNPGKSQKKLNKTLKKTDNISRIELLLGLAS